jgi:hypothetical protein
MAETPSLVFFSKETLGFLEIEPAVLGHLEIPEF